MLEQRQRGEEPDFEGFMERYGDFFPENPQTLDELLEVMAQRMAAMQQMLNSMTPEQRAQLQELSDMLLEDMDLRWQVDQLGQNLREMFPQMGWERGQRFTGDQPMGMSEASSSCAALPARGRSPRSTSTAPASSSATTRRAASSAWPRSPACSRTQGSSRTARVATS
jgi:uncharacterized protein with von Willebrand factor type A (vWA) domain